MEEKQPLRFWRFGWVEAVFIIFFLMILASILFPLLPHQHKGSKLAACQSQLRQIATAVQMYTQDHADRYPGTSWNTEIELYLGYDETDDRTKYFIEHLEKHPDPDPVQLPADALKRIPGCKYQSFYFHCPGDTNPSPNAVSYAYNSELLRPDGSGVDEEQLNSPLDVGLFCDAAPSGYIAGLIGAGTNPASNLASTPCLRHHGLVIAYADGHVKDYALTDWDPKDSANPINKAFYLSEKLGFIKKKANGSTGK